MFRCSALLPPFLGRLLARLARKNGFYSSRQIRFPNSKASQRAPSACYRAKGDLANFRFAGANHVTNCFRKSRVPLRACAFRLHHHRKIAMTAALWVGLGAVALAGLLQGLFAVPMKYASGWKHENIWLVFRLFGMVVLPWLLTTITVPQTAGVYSMTSAGTLSRVGGFGLCWGIGWAVPDSADGS
jgi:hypothetical protein